MPPKRNKAAPSVISVHEKEIESKKTLENVTLGNGNKEILQNTSSTNSTELKSEEKKEEEEEKEKKETKKERGNQSTKKRESESGDNETKNKKVRTEKQQDDKKEEEENQSGFDGWTHQDILRHWATHPPPTSDTFPDTPSSNNFLGGNTGTGKWSHRDLENKTLFHSFDAYTTAVLEYNYRRGVRSFKYTWNKDGKEYEVSFTHRTQTQVNDSSKRYVLNRDSN